MCFRPATDPDRVRQRVMALTGVADPYLIVVGADQPAKRHDLALAAFAAAAPKPWRLVMVQRPASHDHLQRLARLKHRARELHVDDRVVWLAHVERDDLAVLIQGASALLQPSVYVRPADRLRRCCGCRSSPPHPPSGSRRQCHRWCLNAEDHTAAVRARLVRRTRRSLAERDLGGARVFPGIAAPANSTSTAKLRSNFHDGTPSLSPAPSHDCADWHSSRRTRRQAQHEPSSTRWHSWPQRFEASSLCSSRVSSAAPPSARSCSPGRSPISSASSRRWDWTSPPWRSCRAPKRRAIGRAASGS